MPTQSPLSSLLDTLMKLPQSLKAPAWLADEARQRLVLVINHVLQQEPQAQARLARLRGRVVRMQWRGWAMQLAATPAGLCELASQARPDLLLTVSDESPLNLAQAALRGDKPGVRIEGDVQLAGEVNWLVEHLRWDAEEDLARLLGDAPAHALAEGGRKLARALRGFVDKLSR